MEKIKIVAKAAETYFILAAMILSGLVGYVDNQDVAAWIVRAISWLGATVLILRRVALLPEGQHNLNSYKVLTDAENPAVIIPEPVIDA